MLTSSFFDYKGPGRISIARRAPRGDSGYRVCQQLAPGPWFMSVPPREYVRRYFEEILKPLDPRALHDRLVEMGGGTAVLLCWERLPFTTPDRWWEKPESEDVNIDFKNWCHRTLVAAWMEDALGIEVKEWQPEPKVTAQSLLL